MRLLNLLCEFYTLVAIVGFPILVLYVWLDTHIKMQENRKRKMKLRVIDEGVWRF